MSTEFQDKIPAANSKVERRRGIAARMIGLSDLQRLILSTIADDQRPWRILTLADEILYSRAAVRTELHAFRAAGWATLDPASGWSLTDLGLAAANAVLVETNEVANGMRRRFTPALCAAIETSGLRPAKHPPLAGVVI